MRTLRNYEDLDGMEATTPRAVMVAVMAVAWPIRSTAQQLGPVVSMIFPFWEKLTSQRMKGEMTGLRAPKMALVLTEARIGVSLGSLTTNWRSWREWAALLTTRVF